MFKRILLTFILLVMVIVPSQAQNPAWTAWLFNPADGSITQVNNRGEVVGAFGLPLPQAFNAYGVDILMSPTGRYAVYTATDTTVDKPNSQLFVYDSQAQSVVFTYDITDVEVLSFSIAPNQAAFDETHSQIAVGMLRENGWEVIVIDYSRGVVLASLTPDKTDAIPNEQIVPVIHRYNGEDVFLMTLFWGTGGTDSYPAYRWNIGSGNVTGNNAFTSPVSDYLAATGEVVTPVLNDTFELAPVSEGPNLRANTIQAFVGDEAVTVYHDTEAVIQAVHFIQNGNQVLAETYNFTTDEHRLTVINRDGSVVGTFVGSLAQIKGTPDGFIGLFESQGGVSLAFVDTTGGELTPVTIWTGQGMSLKALKLAHVHSESNAASGLPEWTGIAP